MKTSLAMLVLSAVLALAILACKPVERKPRWKTVEGQYEARRK